MAADQKDNEDHKVAGTVVVVGIACAILMLLLGCTTTYYEIEGECVAQEWLLGGFSMRRRMICDLPPPTGDEPELRDREAMGVNPFPGLLDMHNDADSIDPDLLEKKKGIKQDEAEEVTE